MLLNTFYHLISCEGFLNAIIFHCAICDTLANFVIKKISARFAKFKRKVRKDF